MEAPTMDAEEDENQPNGDASEESLLHRIAELERKVQDQTDEVICLRSTLADVVRRVTQLEGRTPVITSNLVPPNKTGHLTPIKISNSFPNNLRTPYSAPQNNSTTSPASVSSNHSLASMSPSQSSHLPNNHKRLNHHPSNSSLHSEGGQSSSSASPVPSPSPSHSSYSMKGSPALPKHPSTSTSYSRSNSIPVSNLMSMRKWSASHDFGGNSSTRSVHNYSGSLFNLHVARPSALHSKHGTKDALFNQEEGTIRIYLRGRPLNMHIPTALLQSYSLNKVNGPPGQRLKLEWVYGYRGRDCRSNLQLLPTGEIVYFIASVIVLYDVEDQIQRHYLGHTDDVKCLTVHPNKLLMASGQVASLDRRERRPHVRIWDSVSLNTLYVIGLNGEFEKAIACLAFSKLDGGNLLCVVDESSEHSISLWEWQRGERGHRISETKSTGDPVLAAEFHPMDRFSLITVGKGHIYFWDIEGGTLAKKIGTFEKQDKPKYMLSIAFTDLGELITGDSNGCLMVWPRGHFKPTRTHSAHEGGIFTVCAMKDGTFVSGGGKDRRIIEWDEKFLKTGREAKLPEQFGGIRVLTLGKGNMLMVGTTKNCILQGTLSLNFSVAVQGHTEEIWCLAVHPTQNQFITGGYDKIIHLWDTLSHSVVWSKDIGDAAQSACFSPDGNVIVVATTSGKWLIIDALTRQLVGLNADGNEQIDSVKFSPDGNYLAIASHDHGIYIYQVSQDFKKFDRIGRCSGHSSFVNEIDWAQDMSYIQSTSGDYELLFWNPSVCRQLSNMSIARDLKMETQNCTLGFNVFGVWPENADGTDINSCDRSHNHKLVATGDDFGRVNLYGYPANQAKCLHHSYFGHSSHVTAVRFLQDDSRLLSVGGRDCSVLQWAVL